MDGLGNNPNADQGEGVQGAFECLCESWLPTLIGPEGEFPNVEGSFTCEDLQSDIPPSPPLTEIQSQSQTGNQESEIGTTTKHKSTNNTTTK